MKHVKNFNQESKINEELNYHEEQLKKIDLDSEYNAAIKIRSGQFFGDSSTNWMDLTPKSALEIIKWLQHNYRDDNNYLDGKLK